MNTPRILPAPPDGKRIESGPIQFGDDWPGYFIRGDSALYAAFAWSMLKRELQDRGIVLDALNVMAIDGHFADMGRCDAQRFEAELKDAAQAGGC